MNHLYNKLIAYGESDMYPYHMPGHKRQACGDLPASMYSMDITEIDGFDNLHQSEEILKDLQEEAARLYGAEESFYLVNGSTSGILSAISCAVPDGGHLLMARNCHKSVYHAAYLRRLKTSYLYPSYIEGYHIYEAITPDQVEEALEKTPEIQAVLIVSPTYEGRIADVKAIAEIVHAKGLPLIVDEAHGAHLGFADGFARNACQCGADLVVHSVHKTLPSLTQTALLHVNGTLIDRDKLRRFLRIYQSSSPSYLLMGSIDNALSYVKEQGQTAFASFHKKYCEMMEQLAACKNLTFLPVEEAQDIGKLVISTANTNLTGKQLYDILLEKYHLQMEMAAPDYVLAMFTMSDSEEAYSRMVHALLAIDGSIEDISAADTSHRCPENAILPKAECAMTISQAWDGASESVTLADSVGRYATEFVNLYPPGVPILVPGERITEKVCDYIRDSYMQGLTVQGIQTPEESDQVLDKRKGNKTLTVRVLKE